MNQGTVNRGTSNEREERKKKKEERGEMPSKSRPKKEPQGKTARLVGKSVVGTINPLAKGVEENGSHPCST